MGESGNRRTKRQRPHNHPDLSRSTSRNRRAAELGIGLQDGFSFPFLANENHWNGGLVDDIFEEVSDLIQHTLRVPVENMLELINENHADSAAFEQGMQACDHIPLGAPPWVGIA